MNTAPGWYDDNTNPGGLRWFDGRDWTAYTAPAPSFAPPGQVGAPPSYAGQPMTPYGHPGQQMPYGYGYPPHPRSQEEGDGPGEVLHWIVPVGRSWQSIVAGYVGLAAIFFWILGPVAIALGILGLRQARAGGHGSGRSIFAIVVGALASLAGLVVLTVT